MRRIIIFVIAGLLWVGTASADFTPIWHCTAPAPECEFVHLLAVGDQNLDGFDDILVTMWEWQDSTRWPGECRLYFGGNPMDTIPDMIFTEPHVSRFGPLPLECRDLNGDSYPDIAIGCDYARAPGAEPKMYVYFGGLLLDNQADLILKPDTLSIDAHEFGGYSSMGDFNGDSYNDLMVSAGMYNLVDIINGKFYVFYGGPNLDSIPDYSITAEPNSYHDFGDYISCSGDVNGDSYEDIICKGGPHGGFEKIMFFGGNPPDTIPDWNFASDADRNSIIIPDIHGDGYDEIMIGRMSPFDSRGYIFFGGAAVDTIPDISLYGHSGHLRECNIAGDLNNDGWMDVVLQGYDMGRLYIFFLNPQVQGYKEFDIMIQSPGRTYAAVYAGDVNGDGIDDFMFDAHCGNYTIPGEIFIYSDTTLTPGVKRRPEYRLTAFNLRQNYPNPFNSSTTITFNVNTKEHITLQIYNSLGQRVTTLLDNQSVPGLNTVSWEGRDRRGNALPSGVYLIKLSNHNQESLKRIIIIR